MQFGFGPGGPRSSESPFPYGTAGRVAAAAARPRRHTAAEPLGARAAAGAAEAEAAAAAGGGGPAAASRLTSEPGRWPVTTRSLRP
jgi:hypothetical protein